MVSNITWKHSGFDAQCFESSYDWQIKQVVLSETAQYGQSRSPEWHRVKEHIVWVTSKNAKNNNEQLGATAGPWTGCVSKYEHCAVIQQVFYRTEIKHSLHLRIYYIIFFLNLQELQQALRNTGEFPLFPGARFLLSSSHLKRNLGNRKIPVPVCFFPTLHTLKVLCYPSDIGRSGSQVSACYPCLFQLHPIWDCEVLLTVPRNTGKWARCAPHPTAICHVPNMHWLVWTWGWNGLAVPYITEPLFLLLTHSFVHCSFAFWSFLVPFVLGSLCLTSNHCVGSSRQQTQALSLTPIIVY